MPILYGFGKGQPVQEGNAPGDADLLSNFLSGLEQQQPVAAPKLSKGSAVMGAISDMLMARAQVLAGGQPQPGKFATEQAQVAERIRLRNDQIDQANTDLRNQARISAFEGKIRLRQEATRQAGMTAREAVKQEGLTKRKEMAAEEKEAARLDNIRAKVAERGIDASGIATFDDALDRLASVDPLEALRNIPDDREVTSITTHPNGSISFVTKPKADRKPVTLEQARQMAQSGASPDDIAALAEVSGFSPEEAGALVSIAQKAESETRTQLSRDVLLGYVNDVDMRMDEGQPVDEQEQITADAADKIHKFSAQPRSVDDVNTFYRNAMNAINAQVEKGTMAQATAQAITFQVRMMLTQVFGNVILDVTVPLESLKPQPEGGLTPEEDAKFEAERDERHKRAVDERADEKVPELPDPKKASKGMFETLSEWVQQYQESNKKQDIKAGGMKPVKSH